ncbi:MAG: hypothetical protein GX616_17180 [Planctomycetes bacterium]|nr:hypothetical protein [Planctomycetota bacterium]
MDATRASVFLLLTGLFSAAATDAMAQKEARPVPERETTPSLQIRRRFGESGGNWRPGPAEIRRDESLILHVEPVAGGTVHWYQIVPDTRKFYKNANYPRGAGRLQVGRFRQDRLSEA